MSKNKELTKEQLSKIRFLKDIKNHKINVIYDSGVNRHLRFKRADSYTYGFDIITWPGHLCITGDCGTYVFARIHDMFNFFTGSSNEYPINTGYWSEKLLAQDSEVRAFNAKTFAKTVHIEFVEYIRNGSSLNVEEVRAMWGEIKDLMRAGEEGECEAMRQVYGFHSNGLNFSDFYENDCREYTHMFMWNLHAIVWGIKQYNKLTTNTLREMNT